MGVGCDVRGVQGLVDMVLTRASLNGAWNVTTQIQDSLKSETETKYKLFTVGGTGN